MGTKFFLINDETKREYEVVGQIPSDDPDSVELVLKGTETGVTFKQKFDKKQFMALGYRKVKRTIPDDDED